MLTLRLTSSSLTSENLHRFNSNAASAEHRSAAASAATALRYLLGYLDAPTLLRYAAAQEDGLAWLQHVAAEAEASRHAVEQERRASADLLREQNGVLHRWDGMALDSLAAARADVESLQRQLHGLDIEPAALKIRLSLAGLAPDEIQAAITARTKDGDHQARRGELEAKLAAAAQIRDALEGYLADPNRCLQALPPEVAARLVESTEVRECNARCQPIASQFWPHPAPAGALEAAAASTS